MRYTVPGQRVASLGLGLLEVAGVWLILRYARQPDDYYQDGTTHWEFAQNAGGAYYAVGAALISLLIAAAFLVKGFFPRLGPPGIAVLGFVVYLLSWFAAYFCLTVGH